jgi:hypothetical protein
MKALPTSIEGRDSRREIVATLCDFNLQIRRYRRQQKQKNRAIPAAVLFG